MSTQAPRRWLETEDLDEALRVDLSAAAADDVGYDVTAAVTRFEATLARGGPSGGDGGGGAGGASSTAGTAAGGKGLALVVGLAVVVGGGAIAWKVAGDGPRTTSAPSSVVAEREVAEPQPALDEREVIAEVSAPVDAEGPANVDPPAEAERPAKAVTEPADPEVPTPRTGRPTTKSRPSTSAPEPTEPAEDDRLHREMRATDRARQALASDPARALSLARKADAEFPEGLFAEDREGIAILALFALDRDAEARRRAAAFLRDHPRSSHADRIRAAMDEAPEKP
jgi:hypothetical protein